jgi:alanine racemase
MNAPGKSSQTALKPGEGAGVLTIDLGALAANWRTMKERAGRARCSAVVKADAYGIGLEPAAAALAAAGCDTFFVALIDEARRLRAALPTATIYVLNGLAPGTATEFRKHRVEPVLCSWPEIDEWDAFAATSGEPLPAAIHIDTGMSRHGLSREEATALAERVRLLNFQPSLVMSHFACADEPANPMNARQIGEFRALASLFPGVPASLSNSAGILGQPEAMFDLVRPGISLYGGRALHAGDNEMRPVVRLDIHVVQVRKTRQGDAVGYGAQHHLAHDGRVAICGAGYADGIFRAVGGSDTRAGAEAIVAGQRCPLVGRVSMDFFAIDVSALPDGAVKRGDYVTILNEDIGVDELAVHAGTIGYEVLTALGHRYKRIYRGG